MKKAVAVLTASLVLALVCLAEEKRAKPEEEALPQDKDGNFVLYVSNQSFDLSPRQ